MATVSAAPSAISADWNRVRKSLAVLCVSHEELDRFFSSTFDQLEALSDELLQRQRAFLAEREQTERELQRQATLLEQQRASLASQSEQVSQEGQSSVVQAGFPPEAVQELERMLKETAEERSSLHGAQQLVEAQATRLAELTDKLLESQRELVQSQGEIQRQHEALEAARAEMAPASAAADPSQAALREQLQRLEQERALLTQERTVLETELDSVRNRAADLAENLAQQQRQMAEDRVQWAEELKYLRRLVERIAQQSPEREAMAAPPAPASAPTPSPRGDPSSPGADPVLDSVMAQFAMLQKDLSQRRKATAPAE
jgi:chromosome segregation ATPase